MPSLFANVLALDEVARTPGLVTPGLPEASGLMMRIMARHPAELGEAGPRPGASEVAAVYDWIEETGQGAAGPERCEASLRPADQGAAMERWLSQVGPEAARDTRFVSLAHLAATCASERELAGYRQATLKVLNSLSWADQRGAVEVVGDTLSLLAFRLSALGWLPAHWERIAAGYPSGTATVPAGVVAATGTAAPVLRADWLAAVATRAPLYYDLLGLPKDLDGLSVLLGAGGRGGTKAGKGKLRSGGDAQGAARVQLLARRTSTAAPGPRLIERRSAAGERALWIAHDLLPASSPAAADAAVEDLVAALFGSDKERSERAREASTRSVFALPNGLPGFALFDGDGKRIDRLVEAPGGPGARAPGVAGGTTTGSASAHSAQARLAVPGIGCLGCHDMGLVPTGDEMRAQIEKALAPAEPGPGAASGGAGVAAVVPGAAVPAGSGLKQLFDDDGHGFRRALIRAGVDPDLRLNGLPIANALARQYTLPVGLDRAAAEFGLERGQFLERLTSFDGAPEMQIVAARLRQGLVGRNEAEALYSALTGRAGGASVVGPRAEEAAAGEALVLELWTDSAVYKAGELLTVTARASGDCHLTLISVDSKGRATVLFPNDFEPENLVRGGTVQRIPARGAHYQLRLKDAGRETLVAVCETQFKTPVGVQHDFERQRFTVLGNWRNFLAAAYEAGAEDRRASEQRAQPRNRGARRVARSRPDGKSDGDAGEAPSDADQRPPLSAHAAIAVRVE